MIHDIFYLNSYVNPDNTSIFKPLALGVLKVIEIQFNQKQNAVTL